MSGEVLTHRDTAGTLLASAKEQFLAVGFEKATVRGICAGAGVSTGACYFNFRDKEALFSALVEPALQQLEHIAAEDSFEDLLPFLFDYRDSLRLLLECSGGSRYEEFPRKLRTYLKHNIAVFAMKTGGTEPDETVLSILADMACAAVKGLSETDCGYETFSRMANALQLCLEQGLRAFLSRQGANG